MSDEKEELPFIRIDRAINRARKRQIYTTLAIVSGMGLAVFLLLRLTVYEAGNTRLGAVLLYSWAMDRKDAKSAVYYAKKMVVLHSNSRTGYTELAYAYLLSKEPEKALETWESIDWYPEAVDFYFRGGDRIYPYYMGVARVRYKMGNRRDAFEEYCSSLNDPRFRKENRNEQIRDTVLCRHLGDESQKFSPFADYGTFLQFMEEEFAAAGEPANKSEAMRMFREAEEKKRNGE